MKAPEYLVIITGLSGSGKSYVQSTLEDLGFYCTDNLPVALIEPFLEEVRTTLGAPYFLRKSGQHSTQNIAALNRL